MKNIKRLRCAVMLFMAVVLLLTFAACNPADLAEENAEVREMTEGMIDAILDNDPAAAYALFPSLTQAEFDSFFPAARKYLAGVESYTLTMLGVNVNMKNGVTQYTVVYRMETNTQPYEITASTVSDVEGFYGFHVVSEKDSTPRHTGTLNNMKGANVLQWGLLIVGLGTYAVIIWALVDCIRRKLHKKWACFLLILLGSVAFLFTVRSGSINFNVGFLNLFSYTALMVYQNPPDALQLRIFVPVGAIVYLALRNRWTVRQIPDNAPMLVLPSDDPAEQDGGAGNPLAETDDTPAEDTQDPPAEA